MARLLLLFLVCRNCTNASECPSKQTRHSKKALNKEAARTVNRNSADLVAEVCEGSLIIKQASEVWGQGPADTVLGQHILSQGVVDGCGGR